MNIGKELAVRLYKAGYTVLPAGRNFPSLIHWKGRERDELFNDTCRTLDAQKADGLSILLTGNQAALSICNADNRITDAMIYIMRKHDLQPITTSKLKIFTLLCAVKDLTGNELMFDTVCCAPQDYFCAEDLSAVRPCRLQLIRGQPLIISGPGLGTYPGTLAVQDTRAESWPALGLDGCRLFWSMAIEAAGYIRTEYPAARTGMQGERVKNACLSLVKTFLADYGPAGERAVQVLKDFLQQTGRSKIIQAIDRLEVEDVPPAYPGIFRELNALFSGECRFYAQKAAAEGRGAYQEILRLSFLEIFFLAEQGDFDCVL